MNVKQINAYDFFRTLYDIEDIKNRHVSYPIDPYEYENARVSVEEADKIGYGSEPLKRMPNAYPADVTVTIRTRHDEAPETVFTVGHDSEVIAPDSLGVYGPDGAVQIILEALLDGSYQYAGVYDASVTCIRLSASGLPDLVAYTRKHHSYMVVVENYDNTDLDMQMTLQLTIGGQLILDDDDDPLSFTVECLRDSLRVIAPREDMPTDKDIIAELPTSDGVSYTIKKVWRVCDFQKNSYEHFEEDGYSEVHAWCVMVRASKVYTRTEYYTLIHIYTEIGNDDEDDASYFDHRWTVKSRLSTEQVKAIYPILGYKDVITPANF